MSDLKIKDFWFLHNVDCWKIKRKHFVDLYLYLPTMRYIYRTVGKEWRGCKTYPTYLTDKNKKKLKRFKNENEAVRWLAGEKIK